MTICYHSETIIYTTDFSDEVCVNLIQASIAWFNGTAPVTSNILPDADIIMSGALLLALTSKALLEIGKIEFSIENDKLVFVIPNLSEALNSVYASEIEKHFNQIKAHKESI